MRQIMHLTKNTFMNKALHNNIWHSSQNCIHKLCSNPNIAWKEKHNDTTTYSKFQAHISSTCLFTSDSWAMPLLLVKASTTVSAAGVCGFTFFWCNYLTNECLIFYVFGFFRYLVIRISNLQHVVTMNGYISFNIHFNLEVFDKSLKPNFLSRPVFQNTLEQRCDESRLRIYTRRIHHT